MLGRVAAARGDQRDDGQAGERAAVAAVQAEHVRALALPRAPPAAATSGTVADITFRFPRQDAVHLNRCCFLGINFKTELLVNTEV